MIKKELQEKLNRLLLAGHKIFIFGNTVVWPEEAEDFLKVEEKKEIEIKIKEKEM